MKKLILLCIAISSINLISGCASSSKHTNLTPNNDSTPTVAPKYNPTNNADVTAGKIISPVLE